MSKLPPLWLDCDVYLTASIFILLSVSDDLLNSKCGCFQLSHLQNAGPAYHRLLVGSDCAEFGAIRTQALRIKYAVTSSKAFQTGI